MIKIFILIILSLNSFAIVPGSLSPSLNRQVVKIQFEGHGVCSGTVLNDHTVLTAGHCVKRHLTKRFLGLKISVNELEYRVRSIYVPKGFRTLQEKYDRVIKKKLPFANELKELSRIDIGIIRVREKITKSLYRSLIAKKLHKNNFVKLCGYGHNQFVEKRFKGNIKKKLYCGFNNYLGGLTSYLFVQGNLLNNTVNNTLTGPGDSGSPLYDIDMKQIGVLSGIVKDELSSAKSYYANLIKLEGFISSHL